LFIIISFEIPEGIFVDIVPTETLLIKNSTEVAAAFIKISNLTHAPAETATPVSVNVLTELLQVTIFQFGEAVFPVITPPSS